jgi:sulfide:quinone oxidoreductase
MATTALVLGGGFAGLEAAIRLASGGLEVTLVSARPYLFVYPTSIWVATGERRPEDVRLDLADVARRRGFRFLQGSVESISGTQRRARVDGKDLTADFLIIATGGVPLRPAGVEHTHALGGEPDNVEKLHAALEAVLARGSGRIALGFGGNPRDTSAVRGGPMFELAFNLHHLLCQRNLRSSFELTFFAPMASPGERMGKKAVAAIQRMFGRIGVATRYGKKITRFEPGAVVFEDDSRLGSDLTVFLPAGGGHPVVAASDLPKNEAGFVTTDGGCSVPGHPGVYAVGDAAALLGPAWKAKQGHLAEVMARVAASNVLAEAAGRTERESYVPEVSIVCLMDMGNGGAFVRRDDRKERLIPLPIVGHWMKKSWGAYYAMSKRGQVPRLPGL